MFINIVVLHKKLCQTLVVKKLEFLFLFIILCLFTACFSNKSADVLQNEQKATSGSLKNVENLKDERIKHLISHMKEADAVHREAWWVVSAERKKVSRSIFGKVQKALESDLGEKSSEKTFNCNQYSLRKESSNSSGYPLTLYIYETCNKSENFMMAQIQSKTESQIQLSFYPQNASEVVGLAASILNKTVVCDFVIDSAFKISTFQCKNMAQDRNSAQMIQFEVYKFNKAQKSMITLKGEVFENLSPVRKIQAEVPLEGKIEVLETQVEIPEGYEKPLPVKKEAVADKKADIKNSTSADHKQTQIHEYDHNSDAIQEGVKADSAEHIEAEPVETDASEAGSKVVAPPPARSTGR